MKKAFTMIELIFVIVILGILAAVAMPKMLGMVQNAHKGQIQDFIGSLNRTASANMVSKAGGFDLSKLTGSDAKISTYEKIPDALDINTSETNLSKCNNSSKFTVVAISNTNAAQHYAILCKNGDDATGATPVFELAIDTNNNDAIGDTNDTGGNIDDDKIIY
jgi:prepilin-type N-terminal cleavage/methylation domain-containing protein